MLERAVGIAVAASLFGIVALSVVFAVQTTVAPDIERSGQLLADGEPVRLPLAKASYADWHERQVIILRLPVDQLSAHTLPYALPVFDGLAYVAYDAKSTFLGCRVEWRPDIGDGWLFDPCHHGMWDAYDLAKPRPGTPAPEPLPVYRLSLRDGALWATDPQ